MRQILSLIILATTLTSVRGQVDSLLSLKDCIHVSLEKNYGIKISRNNRQISDNNLTLQPFLPTITGNVKGNHEKMNSFDSFSTQSDLKKKYENNLLSSDITLNWRLFDGCSMFASYEIKKKLLQSGELNLKRSMENLVADISQQYFYIVTQENRMKTVRQYLEISTLRYNQTLEKYRIGAVSGLEMKQSKIDFNADSSKVVQQEQLVQNAYTQLFEMMNIELESQVILSDTIQTNGSLLIDDLRTYAKEYNTDILLMQNGQELSKLDLRVARANFSPTLDLTTSYRFSRTENSSASAAFSRLNGYNIGVTLSVPIFNGLESNRKLRNAKIELQNAQLANERTELYVISQITQQHNIYLKNFAMINFENESSSVAELNLDAALERYRLGTLSGVEFREIQRSYLEATDRKYEALYQAKVSEINLLFLAGLLLQ